MSTLTLAMSVSVRRMWRLDGRSTARFVGIIVVVVSAIAGMRWLLAGSAEVLGLILAVLASTVLGLWVLAIIRRGVLSVPEIGHTATVGGRENE